MKQKKSAKDMAFDRERAKLRSKIRNLEHQIQYRDKQIEELTTIVEQKEEELLKLNDRIEKSLECTEIFKEDSKKLVDSKKEQEEIRKRISTTLGVLGIIGGRKYL